MQADRGGQNVEEPVPTVTAAAPGANGSKNPYGKNGPIVRGWNRKKGSLDPFWTRPWATRALVVSGLVTVWDNGCIRYIVQQPVGKDGKVPDTIGIDEQNLVLVKAAGCVGGAERKGGPPGYTGKEVR